MPHGYTKPKPKHHGTIPTWALNPTRVPIALLRAILVAAHKYHVPPDLLAGIWREESGSTYPNPAVNSSGYGGLFGTHDYNGTTQAQADLAASILRAGLIKSHGNIPEALSYYNSGRLQGGYTSVPGQISHGTVPGYGGKKGGGGGVVSWAVNTVTGLPGAAESLVTNPVGTILGPITGGISGAIKEAALKAIDAGAIVGGGLVFVLGFVLIAADIGLSTRAGKVAAAIPAGRVITSAARAKTAKSATKTSTAESNLPNRREERAEEAHQSRMKTDKARRKDIRSRTKYRRRTKAEQEAAEKKSYYKGATDAASPTMAKIRKNKKR